VLAPESGPKLDCLRDAGNSWPAAFPFWWYQGSQQPGGPVLQLGIGDERLVVLAVQLARKAGDFLAHGCGQGRSGSAARFPLLLCPLPVQFGFGPDLSVNLG